MSLLIFLIGIPSMVGFGGVNFFTDFVFYEGGVKSFMDVITDIFSVIGLPLGGWLMTIFIATRWKAKNLSEELSHGYEGYKGSLAEKFINTMIVYVSPLILGLVFVLTVLQKFFEISLF